MRNRFASCLLAFVASAVVMLGTSTPALASTDTIVSAGQRSVAAQPATLADVATVAFTTSEAPMVIAAPAGATAPAAATPTFVEVPAPVPAVDKWVTGGGLNVRLMATALDNERVDVLGTDAKVSVTGFQFGQDPRGDGRNKWFIITGSNPTRFVWEGGLTDVAPAPAPVAPAAPVSAPVTSSDVAMDSAFAALAQCESGGNPRAVNRSGKYFGLFQFSLATWRSVGGTGRPSDAPAAEQYDRAKALQARSGWSPWPVCGKKARNAGGNAVVVKSEPVASAPVAQEPVAAPVATGAVDTVIATAKKYLGTRYVLGGNDFNGIDCSGLTGAAYAAVGINLPRYSGSQAEMAKKIGTYVGGKQNAQPGDLLHWSGHVAIALGGGKMIAAPKPGDVVKIQNIWGSPRVYRIL